MFATLGVSDARWVVVDVAYPSSDDVEILYHNVLALHGFDEKHFMTTSQMAPHEISSNVIFWVDGEQVTLCESYYSESVVTCRLTSSEEVGENLHFHFTQVQTPAFHLSLGGVKLVQNCDVDTFVELRENQVRVKGVNLPLEIEVNHVDAVCTIALMDGGVVLSVDHAFDSAEVTNFFYPRGKPTVYKALSSTDIFRVIDRVLEYQGCKTAFLKDGHKLKCVNSSGAHQTGDARLLNHLVGKLPFYLRVWSGSYLEANSRRCDAECVANVVSEICRIAQNVSVGEESLFDVAVRALGMFHAYHLSANNVFCDEAARLKETINATLSSGNEPITRLRELLDSIKYYTVCKEYA